MTKIRTQDKIFLAVVLPVGALFAYAYGWRIDAGKRADALEARSAALVTAEDFPLEKRRAEQQLQDARDELARERKIPPPAAKVKADPAATDAAREKSVLETLRQAGLSVVRSSVAGESASAASLRATGACPHPISRAYEVDGTYPQVIAALEAFHARENAVIVSRVEMKAEGRPRWILEICE